MRRRAFLKGIATTGTATCLGRFTAWGAEQRVPASEQLNVACIGLGGIMGTDLPSVLSVPGVNVVALCDVDANALGQLRKKFETKAGSERAVSSMDRATFYGDYRKLLEKEKNVDAVLIATPDHWHAPIATAAIQAGKHVYCEKPLTHAIMEARRLRELSRASKVVTQMGNQGNATGNLRRNIEVIQAGVLGQVREVHVWHPPCRVFEARPAQADAVPPQLNWDLWLGPAPARPFARGCYHPFSWRFWWDFGNGSLGDFCGHAFNLPVQALKLDHPTAVDVEGVGMGRESYVTRGRLTYHFPARGDLAALKFYFHQSLTPPDALMQPYKETFGTTPNGGCLVVGEKGMISAGLWNADGYLCMTGEKKFRSVMKHEAASGVPERLPRAKGHVDEWVNACRGQGAAFSNFDKGGLITEIGLIGALAFRTGQRLDWDSQALKVPGRTELDALIDPPYRQPWGV
jgi:predicted dehydrogenase